MSRCVVVTLRKTRLRQAPTLFARAHADALDPVAAAEEELRQNSDEVRCVQLLLTHHDAPPEPATAAAVGAAGAAQRWAPNDRARLGLPAAAPSTAPEPEFWVGQEEGGEEETLGLLLPLGRGCPATPPAVAAPPPDFRALRSALYAGPAALQQLLRAHPTVDLGGRQDDRWTLLHWAAVSQNG